MWIHSLFEGYPHIYHSIVIAQWLGCRTRNHKVASSSPVTAVSSLGLGSLNHNWVPDMTDWLCKQLRLGAKYGCMYPSPPPPPPYFYVLPGMTGGTLCFQVVRPSSVHPSICLSHFRGTTLRAEPSKNYAFSTNDHACITMPTCVLILTSIWPVPKFMYNFSDPQWGLPLCVQCQTNSTILTNYHVYIAMPTWYTCTPILFWPPFNLFLLRSCAATCPTSNFGCLLRQELVSICLGICLGTNYISMGNLSAKLIYIHTWAASQFLGANIHVQIISLDHKTMQTSKIWNQISKVFAN